MPGKQRRAIVKQLRQTLNSDPREMTAGLRDLGSPKEGGFQVSLQHSIRIWSVEIMGRRGRTRWRSVEEEYWQLILAGVGPIEAARRIGIARTT